MASNYDTKEVVTDIYPFFRIYKDNKVERFYHTVGLAYVPPSLEDPETGVSSKDVTISPHVSARLYFPKNISTTSTATGQNKHPILVYYHGGGLVLGSAFFNTCHRYINILVSESNAIAISVEYRLAPEHDLPTIYEDCWTALQWVASHASENFIIANKEPWLKNHGDFSRLSIAGDSAGGNIVYHMAMRAGKEGINENVKISGSIFAFPYFLVPLENIEQTISYKMWMAIAPPSERGFNSPMINPLAEKAPCLSGIGCSRILFCIGENDEYIPRELVIQLVEGMKKSGWTGDLEFIEVEGEGHCFQINNPESKKAQDLIKRIASFLQNK